MTDLDQVLKAGTLLIIETGEYSDQQWDGPVRITKDVTRKELVEKFHAEWKPKNEWYTRPQPEDFLPWLVASGHVEAVDNCASWHVGSYSEFSP